MSERTDERERLELLRREINRHDRLYYIEAAPVISDHEYDRLMAELRALEEAHPDWVTEDSPTQRVGGAPIDGFETVEHAMPMLSIENTYDEDEVREFEGRLRRALPGETIGFIAEPKVDGVACGLRYEKGRLVLGATRGDGRRGDDITSNMRTLRSVPLALASDDGAADLPEVFEVRGEVYMPRAELLRINREREKLGLPAFANPRNSTAGTLKLLDSREVAKRGLRFVVHGPGELEGSGIRSLSEFIDACRRFGLPTSPHARRCESIDEVMAYIDEFDRDRRSLDYDTDGVVVKVDDFNQWRRLGVTAKAPRWVIAYKFAPDQAETTIEAVTHQVGKTGQITPVAELSPVQLAGTVVRRASLHNYQEIERKDIRLHDRVIVEKAGEIIPYVVRSLPEKREKGKTRKIVAPELCPQCERPVTAREGEVYVRCENRDCSASGKERLRFFATRRAMDIDGLGPKLIDALWEAGLVRQLPDLYALEDRAEEVEALERVGEKTVENLIEAIRASKGRGLARLLHALSIPHVGETNARVLAEHFPDMDAVMAADADDLDAVPGIAEVMATAIVEFFRDPANREMIERLREAGVDMRSQRYRPPSAAPVGGSGPLAGKTVVVTGSLKQMTREEAEEAVRRAGGKAAKAVSKRTDLVVAGARAGSKAEKAERLGVETIDEEAFIELLGELADAGADAGAAPAAAEPAAGAAAAAPAGEQPLAGETVVVTGTLSRWSRDEVEDLVREAGGKVTGSVSAKTTLLVAGEKAGSKLARAEKLGVKVIDEDELARTLGIDG